MNGWKSKGATRCSNRRLCPEKGSQEISQLFSVMSLQSLQCLPLTTWDGELLVNVKEGHQPSASSAHSLSWQSHSHKPLPGGRSQVKTLCQVKLALKIRKKKHRNSLPSYSLRQVHFQAADMFSPQALASLQHKSRFVVFDIFRPFCQALSHRTTTPSWKFSISHRCSGIPSPCSNTAFIFWNHLQSLFATATNIKCHWPAAQSCCPDLNQWWWAACTRANVGEVCCEAI